MIKVRKMNRWKTLPIDITQPKELKRWKAIVEYHKTGDILLLQQRLGHKNLRSTFLYLKCSMPLKNLLGTNFADEEI